TTKVTCSATDGAGNTGSSSFNVTVQDTTAPVVTVPSDITAEATSAAGAVVTYASSATDAVSGSPATTCDTPSGSTFPLGTTKVTCSATDGAGNTGSSSFNVTVQDTTAPVVTVPSDISTQATSASGAVVTFTSSATDAVSGSPATTCDTPSGSTFPLGTTQVTCSATDGAGNTGTNSFKVTVTYGFSGILQPVNADGSSIFKLGSTVPVKFALTGSSAGIANAVATLKYAKISNGIDGTSVEAVSTAAATTGNLFRYDPTSQQYIFNWSTKGLTVGSYRLTINLGDGVLHTVVVSLR
ncbi:MAG: HYR domain-containing protein, partial [Mycobacteriales bacterium]